MTRISLRIRNVALARVVQNPVRILATLALLWASCRSPSPTKSSGQPPPSYEPYERLMARYLDGEGQADYQKWKDSPEDVAALEVFVSALSGSSPQSDPRFFESDGDALAYWLNLYNALVLREVLRRWPIRSVRDVRASFLDLRKNDFFDELEFRVGGRMMSLDQIEHEVIRKQFLDARIHFALVCGARSCPRLQPIAFSSEGLEKRLETATTEFIASPDHVTIDHELRGVRLSKLFDWYRADFERHAKRRGREADVLEFVRLHAEPGLARDLERARGYRLRFHEYDWAVNKTLR